MAQTFLGKTFKIEEHLSAQNKNRLVVNEAKIKQVQANIDAGRPGNWEEQLRAAQVDTAYYTTGKGAQEQFADWKLGVAAEIAKPLGITAHQLVTNPQLASDPRALAEYTGKPYGGVDYTPGSADWYKQNPTEAPGYKAPNPQTLGSQGGGEKTKVEGFPQSSNEYEQWESMGRVFEGGQWYEPGGGGVGAGEAIEPGAGGGVGAGLENIGGGTGDTGAGDGSSFVTSDDARDTIKEDVEDEFGEVDVPDKVGLPTFEADFNALRSEKGMAAIETRMTSVKDEMRQLEDQMRADLRDEEGNLKPMSLINTAQQEIMKDRQEQIDSLNRGLAVLVDEYNVKAGIINTIMGLKEMDYNASVTDYNTSFNQAIQIENIVNGRVDKADQMANQQQDNANANLSVITQAMFDQGKAWSDLDSATQATITKLEMQGGVEVGMTKMIYDFASASGKKIKYFTYSPDKSQAHIVYGNGTMELINTGMGGGGGSDYAPPTSYKEWELAGRESGTGRSYSEWLEEESGDDGIKAKQQKAMDSTEEHILHGTNPNGNPIKGKDNKISPKDYIEAKEFLFAEYGVSRKDFDKRFVKYTNPDHIEDYKIDLEDEDKYR